MKTKKDFLQNCSCPELAAKALRAGGVDWKDLCANPNDYYAANTGSVPGMIYYADTIPFGKRVMHLIIEPLNELGMQLPKTDDAGELYNWVAWFAWEHTMGEIISYLEQ